MRQQMKKWLYITVLCSGVGNLWADIPAPADGSVDSTKPLILTHNQTDMVIHLESNATTGFKWFLKDYDTNYFTPTQHTYSPPQNSTLMGAPGMETFTFRINQKVATVPQTGKIHFVYAKAWEPMPDTEKTVTWAHM